MKPHLLAIIVAGALISGCANKNYQMGSEPELASACGQTSDVAIDSASDTDTPPADCRETNQAMKDQNNNSGILLQVVSYAIGFALGQALF